MLKKSLAQFLFILSTVTLASEEILNKEHPFFVTIPQDARKIIYQDEIKTLSSIEKLSLVCKLMHTDLKTLYKDDPITLNLNIKTTDGELTDAKLKSYIQRFPKMRSLDMNLLFLSPEGIKQIGALSNLRNLSLCYDYHGPTITIKNKAEELYQNYTKGIKSKQEFKEDQTFTLADIKKIMPIFFDRDAEFTYEPTMLNEFIQELETKRLADKPFCHLIKDNKKLTENLAYWYIIYNYSKIITRKEKHLGYSLNEFMSLKKVRKNFCFSKEVTHEDRNQRTRKENINWESLATLNEALSILNSLNIHTLKLWDIPKQSYGMHDFSFLKNQESITTLDLSECTQGTQLEEISRQQSLPYLSEVIVNAREYITTYTTPGTSRKENNNVYYCMIVTCMIQMPSVKKLTFMYTNSSLKNYKDYLNKLKRELDDLKLNREGFEYKLIQLDDHPKGGTI